MAMLVLDFKKWMDADGSLQYDFQRKTNTYHLDIESVHFRVLLAYAKPWMSTFIEVFGVSRSVPRRLWQAAPGFT